MAASSSELGATLRSWCDRLPPGELACPPAPTGVRADFAAKRSLSWPVFPSTTSSSSSRDGRPDPPQVLAALSRALRLTETERGHLFRLAGQPVPDESHIRAALAWRQLAPRPRSRPSAATAGELVH
jgi:hypothetical protein